MIQTNAFGAATTNPFADDIRAIAAGQNDLVILAESTDGCTLALLKYVCKFENTYIHTSLRTRLRRSFARVHVYCNAKQNTQNTHTHSEIKRQEGGENVC